MKGREMVGIFTALVVLAAIHCEAMAQNSIGVIIGGYEKDCAVKRKDGPDIKCRYGTELFEGDLLKSADIKEVKIQWLSPQDTAIDDTGRVVFKPSRDKKGILGKIAGMISFLRKTPHHKSGLVTRGEQEGPVKAKQIPIVPQPGYVATLISGIVVNFNWDEEGGKAIVFRDVKGKIVFRKALDGKSFVALTPEEIGMKPGEVYTWDIEGLNLDEKYTVRLLSEDLTKQVTEDLKRIDEDRTIAAEEKGIQKAAYLQLMSDTYPSAIALYWLGDNFLTGEDDTTIELKTRYKRHLDMTSDGKP